MALITFSLPVFYLLASFATISESCTYLQCKLFPSTTDVASEFQSLVSGKGVRIVQLYLEVGSRGYRPLDQNNVFFPERWVWANSISEPMLSMGYDYDLFSLGLLNYQVKGMKVHLIEEPSGCLADLNSTCQSFVVGKALLENVTRKSSDKQLQGGDVVCMAFINITVVGGERERYIEYHCCGAERGEKNTTEPKLTCDLRAKINGWYVTFNNVLLVATCITLLFWPAFSLVLPDGIVMDVRNEIRREANDGSREQETNNASVPSRQPSESDTSDHKMKVQEEEDRLVIPVDDASPVTCSVLIQNCTSQLPGFQLSFNVKLVFLSYFVVPFFLYVFVFFHLTLKADYLQEAVRKDRVNLGGIFFLLFLQFHELDIKILIFLFLAPFVIIALIKPNDLVEEGVTVGHFIRKNLSSMQDGFYRIFFFLSQSYLKVLKIFLDFTIKAFLKKTKLSLNTSRWKRMLCVFCVFMFSVIGLLVGVVLAGIFLLIFLVGAFAIALVFSPYFSVTRFVLAKFKGRLQCVRFQLPYILRTTFTFLVFLIALCVAFGTANLCCFLIIKVFGYTLMGFILNAAITTPYAVFLLVVVTNVYFCYANLQHRYKEVKGIILKEWQNNKELLQDEGNFANRTEETIPRELFWFVSGEEPNAKYNVLPIQTEMLYMFRNMICVLAFLFLSLSSVIIFGNLYEISTLVSSIVVFISGVIPKLLLQGFAKEKKIAGWEKIKITRQVKEAVKGYIECLNKGERPRCQGEEFVLSNFSVETMTDEKDLERPERKPEE